MRSPLMLLALVCAVALGSFIDPHDRLTWWMEATPVVVALPLLAATYHRFRFTTLSYCLIALHCCVLLVGAHYTYAEVPLFTNLLGDGRNDYDRLGHLLQGFVPALVGRELLLRTSALRGKWLVAVLILGCLGISAIYEIIEWLASASTGEAANAFLGTQGDVWDTQKDMLMAGIGAALGLFSLAKWQNHQLQALQA